ncbi:hypothetical protein [Crossiella sp. NPDC003009]
MRRLALLTALGLVFGDLAGLPGHRQQADRGPAGRRPKGDGAVYKLMQRLNEEVVSGHKTIDEAVRQFFTDAANHLK